MCLDTRDTGAGLADISELDLESSTSRFIVR